MSNNNPTFCILPWVHAQTKPNGQIKPCCRFDHTNTAYKLPDNSYVFDRFNVEAISFTEALESPEWMQIRDLMKNDQPVPGCWKCYKEEENHKDARHGKSKTLHNISLRAKQNRLWNPLNDTDLEQVKIRYLELSMGTYCNLKCRTCTAGLSSAWVDDENILSNYYDDRRVYKKIITIEKEWSRTDFENVEEIKFTGGEPMLHPNFIKIIDTIISTDRQHLIKLDIFTNASWVPGDKIISRLKQFNTVKINLSIDGLGKVNDYIRYPSEWSTVEETASKWLNIESQYPDRFRVKWAPCINIYNIWQLPQMIDWWLDLNNSIKTGQWWENISHADLDEQSTSRKINFLINYLFEPKYLGIENYPDKKHIIEKLLNHKVEFNKKIHRLCSDIDYKIDRNGNTRLDSFYNKIIGAIGNPIDPGSLQQFIEYTADLDKLRGQDIRTEIPELWSKIENLVEYRGRIQ